MTIRTAATGRPAADHGEFKPQFGLDIDHPGATSSFKQNQFGEANVQFSFHENDTTTIEGVHCVKVELDMDYFKDLLGHFILEVLPNKVSGGKTDPREIYVLRWIAGRCGGVPEFDPPYTIEARSLVSVWDHYFAYSLIVPFCHRSKGSVSGTAGSLRTFSRNPAVKFGGA